MIKFLKSQKKIVLSVLIMTLLLVFADEIVKIVIYKFFANQIGECNGSDSFVHFHPIFNTYGSFAGWKFDITYNKIFFLIFAFAGFLFVVFIFMYMLFFKYTYKFNDRDMIPVCFLTSATIGRIVERIFWDYTLDYIAVKNVAIFDLIDIYLILGVVWLTIVAIKSQLIENKITKEYDRNEKKRYKKECYKNFFSWIMGR